MDEKTNEQENQQSEPEKVNSSPVGESVPEKDAGKQELRKNLNHLRRNQNQRRSQKILVLSFIKRIYL